MNQDCAIESQDESKRCYSREEISSADAHMHDKRNHTYSGIDTTRRADSIETLGCLLAHGLCQLEQLVVRGNDVFASGAEALARSMAALPSGSLRLHHLELCDAKLYACSPPC